MGLHDFPPQNIQRNLDVWVMFVREKWSYSDETLTDIRGHISIEYSVLYLESLGLLGMALWGDVFPIHRKASGIGTFGVCVLGMSGAVATKL